MIFIATICSELFISADNIPYKISSQKHRITEIFGGVNNLFWSNIFSVLSAFPYLNLHIVIYLLQKVYFFSYRCINVLIYLNKTLNTDIWNYLNNKKDTLNVKLKPPVGGSKSLLKRESLRLNRIIKTVDSFRNETPSCCAETKTVLWLYLELFLLSK